MKFKHIFFLSLFLFAGIITSCNKEEPVIEEPKARFTAQQDANNPFTWNFINESLNATSYSWDFGDGNTSTTESPTHTYAADGTYTVKLTATGDGGSSDLSEDIEVVDPNVQLKKLTGETSKTWKLLRDVSNGMYPMQVGPNDRSQIWWAYGLNDPIGARVCLMEEEYIFSLDGSYEYKTNGTVWAEGGVWNDGVAGNCVDETDASAMSSNSGVDLSAWGSGEFTFTFNPQAGTLTVNGVGAHVGLPKVGTDNEYVVPQPSVTYKVLELNTDGPIDMMVLETTLTAAGGYWQFILVSYDNPADEPALPGAPPNASFTSEINGSTVTFTNNSTDADSYDWDFGDGNTSTAESPTHTYDNDGNYTVTLTATNANGTDVATANVVIAVNSAFSASALHGDGTKVWKLNPAAGALAVGPCKGCGEWWQNSGPDVEARQCQFNDEYAFTSEGVFTYATQGQVFAEPYMGVEPAACVDEASLSAAAAPWGSGTHSYTIQEGDESNPFFITVTGTGAFIGLSKAYNGGEYAAGPPVTDGSVTYEVLSYVNDGTKEILTVTLDISGDLSGGAWWTFTLVSE